MQMLTKALLLAALVACNAQYLRQRRRTLSDESRRRLGSPSFSKWKLIDVEYTNVTGYWANAGSGVDLTLTTTISTEICNTDTTETTNTLSAGITSGATFSGMELFGAAVESSVEVTGSYSWSKAVTASTETCNTNTQTKTVQADCQAGVEYQWTTSATQIQTRKCKSSKCVKKGKKTTRKYDVTVASDNYMCITLGLGEPKCPFGYCGDASCQCCTSSDWAPADKQADVSVCTSAPTPVPTPLPTSAPTTAGTAPQPPTPNPQPPSTPTSAPTPTPSGRRRRRRRNISKAIKKAVEKHTK